MVSAPKNHQETNQKPKLFKKVLIANRGEIALRILRACHELGIETVAVHSTADENAMHVRLATESVCIGPPAAKDSYLNIPAIMTAAHLTGADAVHPGIGFLSENTTFAKIVQDHDLGWIGPSGSLIATMGDKVAAKQAAIEAGIPCVPGSVGAVETASEARKIGKKLGFPVIVKAASGGGGRGMKIAETEADIEDAFNLASQEAKAAFGDATVYLEKYLSNPRHIEIQVIGDKHGNALHLGERDCSVQRRHQKLFEEAPSPALSFEQRMEIGELTRLAVQKLGYDSTGTVEYLYEDGEFYFIEMNTRLQVEHPVTEMITGLDLLHLQLMVAAGHPLPLTQDEVQFNGHAIEVRINAEHPETFVPSPGQITGYHAPGGLGVRVDSQIYSGYKIPPYYDSLVAKLIVHANDREACMKRLERCLAEYVIDGIHTSLPLHHKLVRNANIKSGDYTIKWLEANLDNL